MPGFRWDSYVHVDGSSLTDSYSCPTPSQKAQVHGSTQLRIFGGRNVCTSEGGINLFLPFLHIPGHARNTFFQINCLQWHCWGEGTWRPVAQGSSLPGEACTTIPWGIAKQMGGGGTGEIRGGGCSPPFAFQLGGWGDRVVWEADWAEEGGGTGVGNLGQILSPGPGSDPSPISLIWAAQIFTR